MLRNKTQLAIMAVLLLALAMIVLLSIRSANRPAQIPTVNVSEVQTKAVAIFAFGLTGTAQAEPTQTPANTPLTTATVATTSAGTQDLSTTPGCYGLHFVMDITIPDNTVMTPAQVFTKSWLVENSGTCDWQPGFKVVLIGGVAMGGSPFTVAQVVKPGGRIQVSIKMAAPTNQTGIVQGTWKMSDASGTQFGDFMSVVIVVGNTTGTPPTLEATTAP